VVVEEEGREEDEEEGRSSSRVGGKEGWREAPICKYKG